MSDENTGDAKAAGIFETFREAPLAVKAVLAGILVNRLGAFMQVFLLLFMTHRGFTEVQAGTALGAYGFGSVAGVLLGGWFTDRIGTRRTIVASMACTAVLLVAVLYLSWYPALLAAVIAVGAASQLYRPASATLLAELTSRERQLMIFAMSRLALNIGTSAAPLIGVALLTVSYDLLFWTEAVAVLGFAAIAMYVLPKTPSAKNARDAAGPRITPTDNYRALFADRRYLLFLLAQLVIAAVYVQYLGTLPLAMRDAGLETFWYGAMVALNSLVVIAFELQVTKILQHWPSRVVIAIGFALMGTGLAVYALPGGLAVFVAGTVLWSMAEVVNGPTMFTYPAQAGPERLRGRYIASAQAMYGLGSAIGPIGGVALWVLLGSKVWLLFGVVALLAIIPGWYGIRPQQAAKPPAQPLEKVADPS
jgi:MFS family permease